MANARCAYDLASSGYLGAHCFVYRLWFTYNDITRWVDKFARNNSLYQYVSYSKSFPRQIIILNITRQIFTTREYGVIRLSVASVCVSVFENLNLERSSCYVMVIFRIFRSGSHRPIKVIESRSGLRSNKRVRVLISGSKLRMRWLECSLSVCRYHLPNIYVFCQGHGVKVCLCILFAAGMPLIERQSCYIKKIT